MGDKKKITAEEISTNVFSKNNLEGLFNEFEQLEGELDFKDFTYEYLRVLISYSKQAEYNTKEKRALIKELDITYKNLAGELDLSDFVNLEELYCEVNNLTNLNINNCRNLRKLDCCVNQLVNLNLINLSNLEEVYCNANELIKLELNNLPNLKVLRCRDNYLTSLNYSVLNLTKLTDLRISNNNLKEQDLAVFSKFTNLESLVIGNTDKDKIRQGKYNKFTGSLEPLKGLTKLETLNISNTDLDLGLEHLPNNIERIYCSFSERPESQIKALDLSDKGLEGFINLKDLFCSNNRLTNLDLTGLNPDKLRCLYIDNNHLSNQNLSIFSEFTNLNWLRLGNDNKEGNNCNHFFGNVKLLEDLVKLVTLDLSNLNLEEETYPDRQEIKVIEFPGDIEFEQAGELVIDNYPQLKEIKKAKPRAVVNNITSVKITNCLQLESIDINDFRDNQKLEISDCPNLKVLQCTGNQLTSVDFLNSLPSPQRLRTLFIGSNNIQKTDLKFLRRFINLEYLSLGNNGEEKIQKGEYNRFYGSLEPLSEMWILEYLDVSNTDINSGFEHLPELVEVNNSFQERPESKFQDSLNYKELKKKYYEKSQKSQEWLNKNYPQEQRNEVKEIYLNEPSLEGELDFKDFGCEKGVEVLISAEVDNKLVLKNLSEKSKTNKCVNAQEYINKQYPTKEERKEVAKLLFFGELEGELDLSDFVNLKILVCSDNKLTSLNLSNCQQLERINCENNLLIGLDVRNCSNLVRLNGQDNSLISIALPTNPTNLKALKNLYVESDYHNSQLEKYEWRDLHPDFTLELQRR
ncbi:2370_t:CDS:2 [Funneliformis geosporum]|nr:2370_t:CDS:2 [Funneliformis geosporum]